VSTGATTLDALRPATADVRAALIPQRILNRVELGFSFLGLALSTNAVVPLVLNPAIGVDPSITVADPFSRPLWALVILFLLSGLVRDGRRVLAAAVRNAPILALCWLAALSSLWSSVPGTTMTDALLLFVTTVLGFYIGVRFELREVVAMVAWLGLLIAVLSAVFALALPRFGMDPAHAGDWRGVFTTKNELGRMMVIGGVAWLALLLTGEARRRSWLCALFVIFVGAESGSRTALAVASLMTVVWSLVWLFRRRGQRWIPIKGLAVSGCVAVAVLAITSQGFLLKVIGADSSFTGRTGIWNAVLQDVRVHAWFGYGFDGFWLGIDSRAIDVMRAVGFMPPHAHDGYLDLLLNLGLIGAAVFVLAIAVIARNGWRSLHRQTGTARMFPLVFLVLFLLYNISESSLVSKQSLTWLVLCVVAASAAVHEPRPAEGPAT
jgi:O-antigen ligase